MLQANQGRQMTGADIRHGMGMAADSMAEVQDEVKRLAKDSRIQVLTGEQREQFFRGMTQKEFDVLHSMAVAMGERGLNAMERLMQEAEELKKGGQG